MKRIFGFFKVKPEERRLVLPVLAVALLLNGLVTARYADRFMALSQNYRSLFVKVFHISGYDPLTYAVVSDWHTEYNIYRHPLLAFLMYLPAQLNRGLMALTGVNCAQFIVAAILVTGACYSFIFLYRILREVLQLERRDATLMALLMFSTGYVLVSICVPDHFSLSLCMLLLTLYVSGKKLSRGKPFTKWQTVLLFIITAGISLNNGIKVFLANLFVNGRRFFRPANLLLAVALPSVLMWMFARYEYATFQYPRWHARQVAKQRSTERERLKVWNDCGKTYPGLDSARLADRVDSVMRLRALEKYQANQRKPNIAHQGQPVRKDEFWSWTDISTPRLPTLVENLFGESVLLHQDHLLGDTLRGRPVIVPYRWAACYVVVGLFMALFAAGLWVGRRSRLMWLAVSFFALDMGVHMVAGFGINEIYIMSPHWAFVFPIVIGSLLKGSHGRGRQWLRGVLTLLTAGTGIYNLILIISYLV